MVTAIAVSLIFGTPELFTLLFMFLVPLAVILTVLSMFLRNPVVAAWSGTKQRFTTWSVAIVTGVCIGIVPHTVRLFTR